MTALAIAAHALFLAGALGCAGTRAFALLVLPSATTVGTGIRDAEAWPRRVRRLARLAAAGAAAGLAAWVLCETVDLAGTPVALPRVLGATLFGRVAAAQAVLLAIGALGCPRAAGAAAFAALLLEAAHGHAAAAAGVTRFVLLPANAIHLVAAAIWIGGLPPLLALVRAAPLPAAAAAARAFSGPGRIAVAALALSALVQAAILSGPPAALVGTRYGVLLLTKSALFAALVAGALLNRYRFAAGLRGAAAATNRRRLAATILGQTACGLAAVVAASMLGAATPGMDAALEGGEP